MAFPDGKTEERKRKKGRKNDGRRMKRQSIEKNR